VSVQEHDRLRSLGSLRADSLAAVEDAVYEASLPHRLDSGRANEVYKAVERAREAGAAEKQIYAASRRGRKRAARVRIQDLEELAAMRSGGRL
jgi:hypothetical protein